MSEQPKSKRKSGRNTPQFGLEEAIESLRLLHSCGGDGPFSRDAVAQNLGYSAGSGSANVRVAVLTHFGLLDRVKGAYSISEIGKRIVMPTNPDDAKRAIAASASSPALYEELLRDFVGKPVPQLLGNVLAQRYGVNAKSRDEVASRFRESMVFSGLLRNGLLYSDPSEVGDPPESGADGSSSLIPEVGDYIQWISGGVEQFESARRVISISNDMDWVFVGGSDTGIPVGEVTVVEASDLPVGQQRPQGENKSKPAQSFDYSSEQQQYTIPLGLSGKIASIFLPTPFSKQDLMRVAAWAKFMSEMAEGADIDSEASK